MKLLRLAAFAAVVSLAACTSSPTNSATTDSTAPSFDGGNMIGSGNYAGEDEGGASLGSGNLSSDTTTTGSTGTERGTNLIGSGA